MNEWNIQSRAHHCQSCDQAFQDKESFRTLLLEEKHVYLRKDVCESCWNDHYNQGKNEPKEFIAYWQSVYEVPPPAPPDPIQKENAETLLRKLFELNKPEFASAAYILAVMLERKRILKVKEQFQRDGQRIFVYEQPKTGDIFTIADPALQLNELDEVQHTVADLLEYGLTPEGEIARPAEKADSSSSDLESVNLDQPVDAAEKEADPSAEFVPEEAPTTS